MIVKLTASNHENILNWQKMVENQQHPSQVIVENDRLRFTLDHVGAYVFTKDLKGRYTYANAMVCELFCQPLEHILGKTDEEFFDLSISDELRKNDLHVLNTGEKIESEECNFIAGTGEEKIYWTVKIPIRDHDGNITGLCGISTDITARRRLEQELAKQKNLLSLVLENIDAYVYMKDKDRRYLYANEKLAELYQKPIKDIVGKLEEELLPKETAERFAALDRKVIENGQKVAGEEIIHGLDGEDMHCWSIKIPLFNDGDTYGLIGISTNITEVIRLKNEFHELARIDSLTGVLTRRFLIEHLEIELKKTQRRKTSLALLIIDIDYFKDINDTYGHAFGDTYIISIVQACHKTLREGDLMGRLGGDEFVIVIDDTNEEGMATAAERLCNAVQTVSITAPDGTRLSLSISIGVALSCPSSTIDSLIDNADSALYHAKSDGRGCWRVAPSASTKKT